MNKKIISIICAICIMLSAIIFPIRYIVKALDSQIGENILVNPGFENGDLTGWTTSTILGSEPFKISSTQKHNGNYGVVGNSSEIHQTVTLPVSGVYEFSAWFETNFAKDVFIRIYKGTDNTGEKIAETTTNIKSWAWTESTVGSFEGAADEKVTIYIQCCEPNNAYHYLEVDDVSVTLKEEVVNYVGVNLLENSDFETGDLTGWNSVTEVTGADGIKAYKGEVRNGSYSAYGNSGSINQTFKAPVSGTYTATAYVRSINTSGIGYLAVYKGKGTTGEVVASGEVTMTAKGAGGWQWAEITFDFTAVANEEYTIRVYRDYTTNKYYTLNVDDVSVVLKEEAVNYVGVNLLQNADFETGDLTGWNSVTEVTGADGIKAYKGEVRNGSYSAYGNSGSINQTFKAPVSGTYTATAYVRSINTSGTGYLTIHKGKGTKGEKVGSGEVTMTAKGAGGWQWAEITFDFTAVANEEYTIRVYRDYTTNKYYTLNVDDVSVVLKEEKEDDIIPVDTTNLIKNPSFETGDLSDWTAKVEVLGSTEPMTAKSSEAKSGNYSAQGNSSSLQQTFITTQKGLYNVSAFVKGINNGGTGYVAIYEGAGTEGTKIASGEAELVAKGIGGWEYTEINFDFMADADKEYTIYIYRDFPNPYIRLVVDDVSVMFKQELDGVVVEGNLLKNPGFEEEPAMTGWKSYNFLKTDGSVPEYQLMGPSINDDSWNVSRTGDYAAYATSTALYQTIVIPASGTYRVSGWLYANNMEVMLYVYQGSEPKGTIIAEDTDNSNKEWIKLSATFNANTGDSITVCYRGWFGNNNPWLSVGVDDTNLEIIESAASRGDNLLSNGSFELGDFTAWNYTNAKNIGVYDNKNATDGDYCAYGNSSMLYQTVKLDKTGLFNVSAWFKSNEIVDATISVYADEISGEEITTIKSTLDTKNEWKQLSGSFSGVRGDTVVISLQIKFGNDIEQYYDNIRLELKEERELVNLLQNPGFETGDYTAWEMEKDADGVDGSFATDTVHTGLYSAYLTDTIIVQKVTVPTTGMYSFGGWGNANSGKTLPIYIIKTSDNSKIASTTVNVSSAWKWNEISGNFWAEEGTEIEFRVDYSQTQWAHAKFFDDAYLYLDYELAEKPKKGIGLKQATPFGPNDPLWDNVEEIKMDWVLSYETKEWYRLSLLTDDEKKNLGISSEIYMKAVYDSGNVYFNFYVEDENVIKKMPDGYQWFQSWAVEGIFICVYDGVTQSSNYYSNYWNLNVIDNEDGSGYVGMRTVPRSALDKLFGSDPEEFSLWIDYRDTAPESYIGAMSNQYHFVYCNKKKQAPMDFYFSDDIVPGTEDFSEFVPLAEPDDTKELDINTKELSKYQPNILNGELSEIYIVPNDTTLIIGNKDISYKELYNCLIFDKGVKGNLLMPDGSKATDSTVSIKDKSVLKLTLPNGKNKNYTIRLAVIEKK